MPGGIYLIHDGDRLVRMDERAYDSELLLHELLAQYPDLLAGDEIDSDDPRRETDASQPRTQWPRLWGKRWSMPSFGKA